jgi:ubiquitin C-terminal hydrolase
VLTDFEDDSGKKHHCATTRQVFAEIPPIFMISFDKKVLVDIVERIQVGDETFRLVSSAMHAGAQMRRGSAGHYTAMAKHKGTWSLFDDESVTELSEMLSRAGHSLLVYIKI